MAINYFDILGNVTINNIQLVDIFDRIRIKNNLKYEKDLFDNVQFNDGDTLETFTFELYEDKNLYWVVAITNNIKDYMYDLPLLEIELREYHTKEVERINSEEGSSMSEAEENTLWSEMVVENDGKRILRVLKRTYLGEFLSEVNKLKGIT